MVLDINKQSAFKIRYSHLIYTPLIIVAVFSYGFVLRQPARLSSQTNVNKQTHSNKISNSAETEQTPLSTQNTAATSGDTTSAAGTATAAPAPTQTTTSDSVTTNTSPVVSEPNNTSSNDTAPLQIKAPVVNEVNRAASGLLQKATQANL